MTPTLITVIHHQPGDGPAEAVQAGDWLADDSTLKDRYRTAFLHAAHRETKGGLVASIVAELVRPFRDAARLVSRASLERGLRVPLEDETFRRAVLHWSARWNLPPFPSALVRGERTEEGWVWIRLGAGMYHYGSSDETLRMRWANAPTLTRADRILLDPSDVTWIVSGARESDKRGEHPTYELPDNLTRWEPTRERRDTYLARLRQWTRDTEADLAHRGYQRAPKLKAESVLSAKGVPHRHFTWLAQHQVLGMTWDEVASKARTDPSTVRRACVDLAKRLPITLRPAPGRRRRK